MYFLDILVLLGALQGFILSIILWRQQPKTNAARILSALLFLIALATFNAYLIAQSWFQQNNWLNLIHALVPHVLIMPVGPLIYFYVRAGLDPEFRIGKKQRRHFYPVALDLLPNAIALVYVIGVLLHLAGPDSRQWGYWIDEINTYSDIPRWISVTTYLMLSWKWFSASRQPAITKSTPLPASWLREFLLVFTGFQIIWLVQLIPYVIPAFSERWLDLLGWYPIFLPAAIILYWIGLKGYFMSRPSKAMARITKNLEPDLADQISRKLLRSMQEEKLFLDPDLNLQKLAAHLGLPGKTVSLVLNQYLRKNFSDFINQYRVDEFKEKIRQSGSRHFTLSALAFDCGFNSQPTFHRAFKSLTGLTPTEYLAMEIQIAK